MSLAELPRLPGPCVVLANELLDNLPFGLLERTAARVGGGARRPRRRRPRRGAGSRRPSRRSPSAPRSALASPRRRGGRPGCATRSHLAGPGGRVVALDYASTTARLAQRPWTEWVRTYRGHERGGAPLEASATQDITCEVAVDQLPSRRRVDRIAGRLAARPTASTSWWRRGGASGRSGPPSATSRRCGPAAGSREAEALLDRAGLGAFRVLEWTRRDRAATRGTCPGGARRCRRAWRPASKARIASGRFSVKPSMSWLRSSSSIAASRLPPRGWPRARPWSWPGRRGCSGHRLGHVEAARRAARRRAAPATRGPSASASAASTTRPVRSRSFDRATPISRGSSHDAPSSVDVSPLTMPVLLNTARLAGEAQVGAEGQAHAAAVGRAVHRRDHRLRHAPQRRHEPGVVAHGLLGDAADLEAVDVRDDRRGP